MNIICNCPNCQQQRALQCINENRMNRIAGPRAFKAILGDKDVYGIARAQEKSKFSQRAKTMKEDR